MPRLSSRHAQTSQQGAIALLIVSPSLRWDKVSMFKRRDERRIVSDLQPQFTAFHNGEAPTSLLSRLSRCRELAEWKLSRRLFRNLHSRFHQLWAFPERCPRMTCSTNSSPNRLVKGREPNKKR